MFGGGEILIIFVLILLLFGGKELPKAARTFGKWMSVLRRSMNEVRQEFNRIAIEEELKESKDQLNEIKQEIGRVSSEVEKDFKDLGYKVKGEEKDIPEEKSQTTENNNTKNKANDD